MPLYHLPTKRWGGYVAGIQFIFWINMADLAYKHLKDEQDQPHPQRLWYSLGCLGTSLLFPLLTFQHYRRRVRTILVQSQHILLTNQLGQQHTFAHKALSTKQRYTSTSNLFLKGNGAYWWVDTSVKCNTILWDQLFYRP